MKSYRVHYSLKGVSSTLPLYLNIESESKEGITNELVLSKTRWKMLANPEDLEIQSIEERVNTKY